MDYRTNRKMVDSGVEWIGELPEEWGSQPLKSLARLSRSRTRGQDFYVGMENIESGTGKHLEGEDARTSETGADSQFSSGDILFGKLRPYLRKVWLADRDGSCSTEFLVLNSGSPQTNRYLSHALLSTEFCQQVNDNCKGVKMPRADWENVGSIPVPVPPFPLQQAIANYLDHHLGLIDEERNIISKRIELLKEKRSALIFEVVTGKRTLVEAQHLAGIDDWSDIIGSGSVVAVPTPRTDDPFGKSGCLVDSGVEWIGEMPEGWKAAPLRSIVKITSGGTPTSEALFWDGGMAWATPADFRNGETLYETSRTLTPEGIRKAGPMMPIGTILVSCRAPVGKVCMVGSSVSFNQGCKGIEPLSEMNSRYVFYSLQASAKEMEVVSSGTTFMEISTSSLGKISFPCPPLPIQQAIADFLDYETGLINKEIELLTAKNELLSDKRKALIFEAVTGKIEING